MAPRTRRKRLCIEQLEERSLMSAGPIDDFVNTLAGAQNIALPAVPLGSQLGTINYLGDVDVFEFTALATADLSINLLRARQSGLDGLLVVHDGAGHEIARNDNRGGDTPESQVAFRVTANQQYYIEVAASPFSLAGGDTGGYVLTFASYTDDFGGQSSTAHTVALPANTPAVVNATIEETGDVDFFAITAARTGGLSLALASRDSELDAHLSVYHTAGNLLAHNDDSLGTLNSQLALRVQAGQQLFVRATGSPFALSTTSLGAYTLTASMFDDEAGSTIDDFGNATVTAGSTTRVRATSARPATPMSFASWRRSRAR